MWQKTHDTPFEQPLLCMNAQGLQVCKKCPAEPTVGNSSEPNAGVDGGPNQSESGIFSGSAGASDAGALMAGAAGGGGSSCAKLKTPRCGARVGGGGTAVGDCGSDESSKSSAARPTDSANARKLNDNGFGTSSSKPGGGLSAHGMNGEAKIGEANWVVEHVVSSVQDHTSWQVALSDETGLRPTLGAPGESPVLALSLEPADVLRDLAEPALLFGFDV